MLTCSQQEAACALDCLKSTAMVTMGDEIPDVASIKCSLCHFAAGKASAIISKVGCTAGRVAIATAC